MKFKILKSEIVSHLSYMISSKNEAAVIDPRRDCEKYLETARKWETKIKYIFETHRNEDYVIGSLELANATGAQVYHGPGLDWAYGKTIEDGQEFAIGSLKIVSLHTPGHSPESTCYVLFDNETGNQPVMVFTGDTLFVGDVGRTDFLGNNMTPVMSEKLYKSLFEKLLPLGDGVIVLPAHGAGSVCGGKISEREISTIGIEKATNPMLQLSKEQFVATKAAERHETPPYFKKMEQYNLLGPPISASISKLRPLKPSEFNDKMKEGAYIVDIRTPAAFGAAHIPGSYSLPPSRLSMAGWVLPYDKPILIVADNIELVDFVERSLYRIGYDNVEGYLANGFESWYKENLPVAKLGLATVDELNRVLASKQDVFVLDVRRENEWNEGHIEGATRIYVGKLQNEKNKLPRNKPIFVICKTGNRSSFGASVLLREGFSKVRNVLGGIDAWKKAAYPLVK
ncbi:MAG: MBL fold metallo-hydrolase [Candidatus Bathyarchaeia archaeon]